MKPRPTNKILIVLMFWKDDKAQAMKLARLLADIELGHSNNADFLFVSRFDCEQDMDTVRVVARKFNCYTHQSKRRGTGWPAGCNSIFFGALEYIYHNMNAGKIPNYKAIFIIGADGAPMNLAWLEQLHLAWDHVNKNQRIFVAGAMVLDASGANDHINGDCILLSGDLQFMRWLAITVGDVTQNAGWDWCLAKDFRRWGWAGFPMLKSLWRVALPYTQERWEDEVRAGTAWLHGVKNEDLINLGRKNLLGITT